MTLCKSLALAAVATVASVGACGTDILGVTDPDIVLEANSAPAAIALKNGVLLRLAQALNGVQGPDAFFVYSGLVTDEWRSGDTFVQRNNQDQRIWDPTNTFNADPYRRLNRVRVQGYVAIPALRQYVPDSVTLVGRMFAVVSYVETLIGENYCNGTPLSTVVGTTVVLGQPLTNDSLFGLAIATADSALGQATVAIARGDSALANPTPGDTARYRRLRNEGLRVQRLAAVVKGRALLDRGQFGAASAAVAGVPDTFKFQITHSTVSNTNQTFALNNNAKRYTMVDREGGVGLDFISANDPRLPRATGTSTANDLIFDSAFPLFVTRQGIWSSTGAVSIVTGVEARLIEAEALLQGGNTGGWLAAIDSLRIKSALYPTAITGFTRGPNLTAIADTFVNTTSRWKTHFRERAFWMFNTGHRLGDLRRMMRQQGFVADSLYPGGAFFKGGAYGTATMMPVPSEELNNPNFTGCLDRNP
jgi:starch-binding outer membrane protein, SusD/RagB family